jgi:hypothetical protein
MNYSREVNPSEASRLLALCASLSRQYIGYIGTHYTARCDVIIGFIECAGGGGGGGERILQIRPRYKARHPRVCYVA